MKQGKASKDPGSNKIFNKHWLLLPPKHQIRCKVVFPSPPTKGEENAQKIPAGYWVDILWSTALVSRHWDTLQTMKQTIFVDPTPGVKDRQLSPNPSHLGGQQSSGVCGMALSHRKSRWIKKENKEGENEGGAKRRKAFLSTVTRFIHPASLTFPKNDRAIRTEKEQTTVHCVTGFPEVLLLAVLSLWHFIWCSQYFSGIWTFWMRSPISQRDFSSWAYPRSWVSWVTWVWVKLGLFTSQPGLFGRAQGFSPLATYWNHSSTLKKH